MGAMKDVYEITHYGTVASDYQWEEHFTDSPTRYHRVRIFYYGSEAYLVEELDGMIICFDKIDPKEIE